MAKKRKKSKSGQRGASDEAEGADKTTNLPEKGKPDRRKSRSDGIIMTLYPAVLGVIMGFASLELFGTGVPEEGAVGMTYPWYFVMTLVIAISYYIQRFTYPFMKINVDEFKAKDWFYVEFIAVDLWLVSWTLLLN